MVVSNVHLIRIDSQMWDSGRCIHLLSCNSSSGLSSEIELYRFKKANVRGKKNEPEKRLRKQNDEKNIRDMFSDRIEKQKKSKNRKIEKHSEKAGIQHKPNQLSIINMN